MADQAKDFGPKLLKTCFAVKAHRNLAHLAESRRNGTQNELLLKRQRRTRISDLSMGSRGAILLGTLAIIFGAF